MMRFQRDRPESPRVRGGWEAVRAGFDLDGSFAID
jgi:hypothetical protein